MFSLAMPTHNRKWHVLVDSIGQVVDQNPFKTQSCKLATVRVICCLCGRGFIHACMHTHILHPVRACGQTNQVVKKLDGYFAHSFCGQPCQRTKKPSTESSTLVKPTHKKSPRESCSFASWRSTEVSFQCCPTFRKFLQYRLMFLSVARAMPSAHIESDVVASNAQ